MEVSSLLMLVYKRLCIVTLCVESTALCLHSHDTGTQSPDSDNMQYQDWKTTQNIILQQSLLSLFLYSTSTCASLSWLFAAEAVWTGHRGVFSMPDLLISCLIISRSLWALPPTLGWSHTQPGRSHI